MTLLRLLNCRGKREEEYAFRHTRVYSMSTFYLMFIARAVKIASITKSVPTLKKTFELKHSSSFIKHILLSEVFRNDANISKISNSFLLIFWIGIFTSSLSIQRVFLLGQKFLLICSFNWHHLSNYIYVTGK